MKYPKHAIFETEEKMTDAEKLFIYHIHLHTLLRYMPISDETEYDAEFKRLDTKFQSINNPVSLNVNPNLLRDIRDFRKSSDQS